MSTGLWTTELGIVGLTISSLITLIFYIVISSNRREDKRAICFQEAINEIHQLHKQERSEWREDANTRQKQSNEAMNGLTRAINDLLNDHQVRVS